MCPVAQKGKRVGPKRKRTFQPALLLLALGVTVCMVAWGYLVKAAIDFGSEARGGRSEAWWFLGLASLGAVACLFVGLMLAARVTRRLGLTRAPSAGASTSSADDDPGSLGEPLGTITVPLAPVDAPAVTSAVRPRQVGGRRVAR